MVVSLEGHSYNESQDAALPARELCLLCTYPQEPLASQQHLEPASSNLMKPRDVGGWAGMTLQTQRTGSLCSTGKPGKQMSRREKRCERDEEMSHLHAFNISKPPGKMCWNVCGWGGRMRAKLQAISSQARARNGSPYPRAISSPVLGKMPMAVWHLGPWLERKRWGHSKVSRAG